MPPLPTVLFVEIGAAALLLALLAARPGITRSAEGKILAAIALFVAPAVAAYGGVTEHLDRTRTTQYCLSCHVMTDYGRSMRVDDPEFLAATHYQNNLVPPERACSSCHSDYGWSGDTRAKARGFKHVMETYFGTVPDTIRISHRYRNRECLHCHMGSRSFEESAAHLNGVATMADIRSGRVSCLKSGCHNLVHEVHHLEQMAFWDPRHPSVHGAGPAWAQPAGAVPSAASDSGSIAPGGGVR